MGKESQNKSARTQRFWDAFKACAEDNRVRPDSSPFYIKWVRAFAAGVVKQYLEYLATVREVAASTQNQALNALVFFYTHALKRPSEIWEGL